MIHFNDSVRWKFDQWRHRYKAHDLVRPQNVDRYVQVRYGVIRRSSASPRPPCDGTPSASVWPSPRQTPGPPCPYPSYKTSPDAIMKPMDDPSAWSSHSDLDKKDSDGRDLPQGVAPHAHRGVVGAHDNNSNIAILKVAKFSSNPMVFDLRWMEEIQS